MSSENPTPVGPPQAPPDGPQQPRWAWWVVGILVPLVGILVTVLVSGSDSSDDKSTESAPTPTRSSAPADAAGQEQPSPSPTKSAAADLVRYGPAVVDADVSEGGAVYIELDTSEPIAENNVDINGADIIYQATGDAPTLGVPDSADHLAPLPASDTPTAATCVEAVERNGSYVADGERGDRFCLLTDEGNAVYLRVVAAPPGRGIGKLDVTVWETPAA